MCAYRDASAPRWEILSDSPSLSAPRNEDSESESVGRAVNYPLPKRKAALPPVERPQKFARTDTSRRPGMPSVEPRAPSSPSKNVLESRPSAISPSVVKRGKKKVVLTRHRELIHSLLKLAPASTSNGVSPRPHNADTHSEDVQAKRPGNPRDVIVLSSDDDTPSSGNANNPIVLDSDDDAEPPPKAQVPAVTSFLDAVHSTSSPHNNHLKSPTSPEFLAGPHSPQRGSSPPMSSESEDSVLAVLTTVQGDKAAKEMSPLPGQSCKAKTPEQPPPSPHPSTQSVMRIDSPSPSTDLITFEAKTKTRPTAQSPEYGSKAEVPEKIPITTPQPESERPSGPPLSPSLVNHVPKIGGISNSPKTAHVSVSLSPSRRHEDPAGAPTGSPHVTVRGTLYGGPSGLWKNFFKASTVSASESPQRGEWLKERSGELRAESPSKSLTRASLPWKKPVGINPAQSSVVEPDAPGTSENSATPNDKSKSPAFATGICPPSQYDKLIDLSVVKYTPARTMLEFPQKVYYARDIPHSVQDLMNSMDAHYRRSIMAKEMFEAVIIENTYEDEPNSPHISIVNDVDGDQEVTPAWEFHYSNHIWHSEDVPPPDLVNLRGCDCKGHCDPRSQTCSCLKRQHEYSDDIPGFIYDDKGRLKRRGYPIFECNDLCGCLDDCRNRVVQRGRQYAVNIRKTTNKGWGVFAGRQKIPKGSFIGMYAGELLSEKETEERGKIYNKVGRTYLFELDFYHLRKSTGDDAEDDEEWQAKYVMDAYHAGNFTRFLNHSCDPNCAPNACYVNEGNIEKPLVALFTRRDVLPWEELCFSYSGYDSDDEFEESENVRANNGDAVYAKCLCGAKRCTGYMFN